MIKVAMSYQLRGAKVQSSITVPEPTAENLTKVLKHVAWVAGQAAPEIEVIESDIH